MKGCSVPNIDLLPELCRALTASQPMRLKLRPSQGSEHAALASAVSWAGACLASGGDDQYVQRWTSAGQASGHVSTQYSVGASNCMLS